MRIKRSAFGVRWRRTGRPQMGGGQQLRFSQLGLFQDHRNWGAVGENGAREASLSGLVRQALSGVRERRAGRAPEPGVGRPSCWGLIQCSSLVRADSSNEVLEKCGGCFDNLLLELC